MKEEGGVNYTSEKALSMRWESEHWLEQQGWGEGEGGDWASRSEEDGEPSP